MTFSITEKNSLSADEKIDFFCSQNKEKRWRCMFRYSNSTQTKTLEFVSDYFTGKNEYLAVLRALKNAEHDVRQFLKDKNMPYNPNLLKEAWNKYMDTEQLKLF